MHHIHINTAFFIFQIKKRERARNATASATRPRRKEMGDNINMNREFRRSSAGGVPMAQIDPRDRVADATASYGNNGLQRDRVPHAAA